MNQRFVVTNQHGHYVSKKKIWTDGREPGRVLCTRHRDEALNALLEINAKDIEIRGQVVSVEVDEKGQPTLEVSSVPLPEPDLPEELAAEAFDLEQSESPDEEGNQGDQEVGTSPAS